MSSAFLLLHGLYGSSPEHWQQWLAPRLRDAGHRVAFPNLPNPDAPDPLAWQDALLEEVAALDGDERVVLCHSLSCIAWLHACPRVRTPVDRVALVAPPSLSAGLPELEPFFPVIVTAEEVARAARHTRLICSDEDPYCPEGAAGLYGGTLNLPVDLQPGRGHLNVDAGLGPWPAMEAWAQGAKNGVDT
jgi:predicted alpha/beta hydrolase family esterase